MVERRWNGKWEEGGEKRLKITRIRAKIIYLYPEIREHTVSPYLCLDVLIYQKAISSLKSARVLCLPFVYLDISGKHCYILKSAHSHRMLSKQTQFPSSLLLPSCPILLPVTTSTKQREHADSVPKAMHWKPTENLKTCTYLEGIPKATDSQNNEWNCSYSAPVGLHRSRMAPTRLSDTSFNLVALLTFFLLLSI